MEAVNFLTDWIKYLLLVIPAGATATVTYYGLKQSVSTDFEEIGHCKVRIKQTIKGAAIGMAISGFITIVRAYYS